jgi:epoxide hydrolase 4
LSAGIPGLVLSRSTQQVTAPVLVIYGECDPYLECAFAEPKEAWASNVQIEKVPDAGHWVHVDAPARVNTLLTGFVRGVAAKQATAL